jgi:hypothetical protein
LYPLNTKTMKRLLLLLLILTGLTTTIFGQSIYQQFEDLKSSNKVPPPHQIFKKVVTNTIWDDFTNSSQITTLQINEKALNQMLSQKPHLLSLYLPTFKDTLQLDLFEVSILSPDFKAKELSSFGESEITTIHGSFYRGIIHKDSKSLVAISFINGEVSGIIADSTGTRVLGKIKGAASNEIILYYESNLKKKPDFQCDANDISDQIEQANNDAQATCSSGIGIYFEADKSMYDQFNGSSGVQTYVASLFNQVATMYSNENINILISGISVWTTNDPYQSATTTGQALSLFKNRWNGLNNNFPGQLAHLLSRRSLGGGIAYVNVLCGARTFAYAVSALDGYFNNYPTYSWDLMVLTHELGHNFGSPHTQSCTWPGGAIDNCYTTEGGCPPGPAPTNGGTVMSYCHLTTYGINLANGFGTLPGNLIRERYAAAAACHSQPNATAPTNLTTTQIFRTKVTLNWDHAGDFTPHTIQYRRQNSTDAWTEIKYAFTGYVLTGLLSNTAYSWQVRGECSDFSVMAGFTTALEDPTEPYCEPTADCTDNDGLNSLTVNAVQVSQNSGCSPNGYRFFSAAPTLVLQSGNTYPFMAQLLSASWPEHVKIWIDYNKNNIFENEEVVFATSSSVQGTFNGNLTIAPNAIPGTTRMRVRVKYNELINNACELYTWGETEDYPIQIISPSLNCESVSNGAWTSSATWSCGRIPLATDEVIIKTGHNITLNAEASAKSLEIQTNSTLQYQSGGHLKLNH